MKHALALVALAALIALPACSRAGRVNTISEPGSKPEFIQDERFINDPGLVDRVELVGLVESEAPGGFRQVQAELFNDTGRFRNVEYAFRWYNADGMEVRTNVSQWNTVGIQPGDLVRITGTAPTPEAQDFRLALRRK